MPRITTKAVKITKKNWSTCANALGARFAMTPPEKMYGRYCILEDVVRTEIAPGVTKLTVRNSWLGAKSFFEKFRFIGEEIEGQFVPIEAV